MPRSSLTSHLTSSCFFVSPQHLETKPAGKNMATQGGAAAPAPAEDAASENGASSDDGKKKKKKDKKKVTIRRYMCV